MPNHPLNQECNVKERALIYSSLFSSILASFYQIVKCSLYTDLTIPLEKGYQDLFKVVITSM